MTALNISDPRLQASSDEHGRWMFFQGSVRFSTVVMSDVDILARYGDAARLPRPTKTQPSDVLAPLDDETAAWEAASDEAWESIDDAE